MRFTDYSFGSLRVDGVTYDRDLIIDRGKIRKRKKAASRKFRGAYGHTPLSGHEDDPGAAAGHIKPDERDMLLDTLAAFFAFQGSAIEAGKHPYCHPNTVRHRLHRMERQTGRSLHDPRSSAELFVALVALRTLPGPMATPRHQVKALCPVMSRPTRSVWISAVPS